MGRTPELKVFVLPLLVAGWLSGCVEVRPKVLGGNKKIDFSSFDTGTQNSFNFNFALRGASSRANTTVYLQGGANTKSGLISTCNLAGTGCSCEFQDSTGAVLSTTTSTQINYDERGNYFRCIYTGAVASLAKVRIYNNAGTITSPALEVASSLTLAQLIGNELDINRVRYVYRYACEYTYLQKEGTTTLSFDCSNQATRCDTGNFCLLKTSFPFYLYSDTYSTNFFQKIADKIYNGGGTDKICGLQIKQINCADSDGVPVKKFGLYSQLIGIWDTAVQLPSAPDQSSVTYGFAARTSATTGECPPGLEKRVFYTVNIVTSDITPTHNFASAQIATEVSPPSTAPSDFAIHKWGQGACNGTVCTLPLSYAGLAKTSQAYSSSGQTEFCVIPPEILP